MRTQIRCLLVVCLSLMVPLSAWADELRDAAFRDVLETNLPLSPQQIEKLHRLYDMTQQAASATPDSPPTPVSSSMVVEMGPGQTPPVIRLSAGFVTSLVFVDSTGAPWPIESYGIGNPDSYNVQWDQSTNALFIQAMKAYTHGNLAIRLLDLNTPVMISLVSGQKEVDYRVDLQVKGRGPNAIVPVVIPDFTRESENLLLNLLDNIPPANATRLQVNESYGNAWLVKDRMYFRTHLTLLSPAWASTISSPDGTRVYELAPTSLLLATYEGQTLPIKVTGL